MKTALRLLSLTLVATLVSSPTPAAEAAKDLSKTPQGAAYQTLLKAVDAGDFEGYKKSMTKAAGEGIDKEIQETGMEPKKGMEILKAMAPTNLKFTGLKVEGKKATLSATGKMMDEAQYGTIDLEEESGAWKVAKQAWTNKKR
jgi:hypothetical protein